MGKAVLISEVNKLFWIS